MDNILLLAPFGSIFALLFAWYLAAKIMRESEGTETMVKIAAAIRKGANAYLKRQYTGVALFFAGMFILLFILQCSNTLLSLYRSRSSPADSSRAFQALSV